MDRIWEENENRYDKKMSACVDLKYLRCFGNTEKSVRGRLKKKVMNAGVSLCRV